MFPKQRWRKSVFDLVQNVTQDDFLWLQFPVSTAALWPFVDRFIAMFGIDSVPKIFGWKVHDWLKKKNFKKFWRLLTTNQPTLTASPHFFLHKIKTVDSLPTHVTSPYRIQSSPQRSHRWYPTNPHHISILHITKLSGQEQIYTRSPPDPYLVVEFKSNLLLHCLLQPYVCL